MEFNRKAPLRVKMLLQTHLVLIETHRVRCSLFRHQPREKLYIRVGRRKSVGLPVAWAFLRKVRQKRRLRPTLRSGHDFFKMVWSSFLSIIFSFVPLLQWNLISPSTSDVILKKRGKNWHLLLQYQDTDQPASWEPSFISLINILQDVFIQLIGMIACTEMYRFIKVCLNIRLGLSPSIFIPEFSWRQTREDLET